MKNMFLFFYLIAGLGVAQANECRIHGENRNLHRLKNSESVIDVESMEICYNLAILKAMDKHEARGFKGEMNELKWVWTFNDGYLHDSNGAVNFRTPQFYKYPGTGDRFISNERLKEVQENARNEFE